MGAVVCSSHVVSATPSSKGGGLLTLCPCSSVRSLSQETALHRLLQHESFPQAAALHKLPLHGSLPRGAVLQEQAAPAWVSHGVYKPCQQTCSGFSSLFLSMGAQVLPGACSTVGSPRGHSFRHVSTCYGVGSLPQAIGGDLLHHGLPWAAGTRPAPPWYSSWAAGEKSLLRCLEHLLPPPSSLTLVSAEWFLSHRLTPLSSLLFHCPFFSFPFLYTLSQRHYHYRWLAWPWPVVGPS